MTLHWVSLPWATFGILVRGDYVVDAAPIARWTVGKLAGSVYAYYLRKGAELQVVSRR